MAKKKNTARENARENLDKALRQKTEDGIQVNKKQNTINMCSQMPNVDLWVKEIAANASDAGASRFWVYSKEIDGKLVVICEDNGHGMTKQVFTDHFTVYRSRKKPDNLDDRKVHGTHGLGKLTVAKIPGQVGYKMITSTGEETWVATTGSLINCDPIKLEKQHEVLPQGTRLEVTIDGSVSRYRYMQRLHDVLNEYARFLRMEIHVQLPGDGEESEAMMLTINENWKHPFDPGVITSHFSHGENHFDIVMGLGPGSQEIYQSRILITREYNLISYDLPKPWEISNLWIRVDSPDFQLPFGRHRLMNEKILYPVSRHIREELLPRLIQQISLFYPDNLVKEFGIGIRDFEQHIYSLLFHDGNTDHPWFDMPVFKAVVGDPVSLNQLLEIYEEKQIILIEDGEFDGVDFTRFEIPVLVKDQPDLAMKVIKDCFSENLIKIGANDLVFEPRKGEGPELPEEAIRFQKTLGMKDGVFGHELSTGTRNFTEHMTGGQYRHLKRLMPSRTMDESMQAIEDLQEMEWRVNYLLDSDGETACKTHMFIYRRGEIVLNLHHSEVQQLIELSKTAPALAGHWATALCLSDKRNVLPHLSEDVREDLLTIDAMLRAGEMGVADPDPGHEDMNDPDYRVYQGLRIRRKFRNDPGDLFSKN
jgi:hypothetical protein